MIVQETGKICNGFYVVGSASVPVYLLDSPAPVLFDAGFTEKDAVAHIENSFHAVMDYLAMTEKFLVQEKGEVEKVVKLVKKAEWDPRPWPKQPESAYLLNTWQRVNTIWKRMNQNWAVTYLFKPIRLYHLCLIPER